ncbi:MAG: hypothetical protein K0R03_2504, partial [Moraxellaceae bacterium]|nr:hypothetical protein [Moraxellaceae bacterium]
MTASARLDTARPRKSAALRKGA